MSENLKKFLELVSSNKELEAKALACNELGEEKGRLAFIELAKENGIVLMTTEKTMYYSCGLLYKNGLCAESAVK